MKTIFLYFLKLWYNKKRNNNINKYMARSGGKTKNKNRVVVAVSGYFNPLHVGHLEMIEKSKKLGDYLVVIVNNDYQVALKGSVPFMNQKDRIKIAESLKNVDEVFLSIDKDKTVCKSLTKIKPNIFANGGDRKNLNDVPEYNICQKLNIKMVDGLGKKIKSSSILIKDAFKQVSKKEKKRPEKKSK
ncbi:MAG: adenylyltransferase/cytidyltransferase family protein [Patescibacteria group bacterium]|jgi:cytidyltransferase-like protein